VTTGAHLAFGHTEDCEPPITLVEFLLLGLLSAVLVFLERPTLRVAGALVVAVWSFCRFYYFAFYVLERYVDPAYHYLWTSLRRQPFAPQSPSQTLSGVICDQVRSLNPRLIHSAARPSGRQAWRGARESTRPQRPRR